MSQNEETAPLPVILSEAKNPCSSTFASIHKQLPGSCAALRMTVAG